MQLENLRLDARPIRPWEAVDLGLRLGAVHWWRLCLLWLAAMAPWVILVSLLPLGWGVKSFLVWWLKPLPERVLLFVLSRAVFGEVPSVRAALKAFPGLARPQWLASLTWRRLSPSRSMDLPVQQLEGLSGKRRRERLKVLHGEQGTVAGWLTILGVHVESLLALNLVILMLWLVPPQLLGLDDVLGIWSLEPLWFVLGVLSMAAMAPFYVAGGFVLYLNRRIQLEGWDIQLAFQRLAHRHQRHQPGRGAGALAALALVAALFGNSLSQQAWAGEARTPEAARETVQRIIDSEEITHKDSIWVPAFMVEPDQSVEPIRFDFSLAARVLEWLGWGLLVFLAVWLLYRYRALIPVLDGFRMPPARSRAPVPDTLFGLDLREASLPADVIAEVRQLWQAGEAREAMALLYRATLSRLLHLYAVEFARGDTEGDCQRRIRALQQPELDDYFQHLTRVWQQLAYAHRPPRPAQVEQLCQRWTALFESPETEGTQTHPDGGEGP